MRRPCRKPSWPKSPHGQCEQVGTPPKSLRQPLDAVYVYLYHFDVFGLRCVSCPILFVTFGVPCLGCSWRPEDVNFGFPNEPPLNRCHTRFNNVITDWCDEAGQVALDVGEPHCVSPEPTFDPNWGYDFDLVGSPGTPTVHHCEKCVYLRNLGFLIVLPPSVDL